MKPSASVTVGASTQQEALTKAAEHFSSFFGDRHQWVFDGSTAEAIITVAGVVVGWTVTVWAKARRDLD